MNGPDQLPNVASVPTKRQKGAARLSDQVGPMVIKPLRVAFDEQWTTDAHFSCYTVRQNGEEAKVWPRLKKVVLDQIEEKDGEVVLTMLTIDYDTKDNVDAGVIATKGDKDGKVPWDEELITDFWARVDRAVEEQGLPMPNVLYTTTNGARFVYILPEPMNVRQAEDYHRGLVVKFGDAGLVADPNCSDWTRLFRLPAVNRDGRKTWESPFYHLLEQFDSYLDIDSIEPIEKLGSTGEYAPVEEIDRPAPTPEECARMLEVQMPGKKGVRQTGAYKAAKHRLRGRNCYPALFDYAPIARQGERDSTLMAYVGEAVGLLYGVDTITPEFVYALFVPSVEQLTPDEGCPNWLSKLWYLVTYTWAREDAQFRARAQKEKVEVKKIEGGLDAMLDGMRSWCKHPALDQDDNNAKLWMLEHSIAMSRSGAYYLLRPDGYYESHPTRKDALLTGIKESGLGRYIEVMKQTEKGDERLMSPMELLGRYGTRVHEVRGAANWPGGIIDNIHSGDSRLVVALYHLRTDLDAQYDEKVDRWMTKLVGEEHVQALRDWIGFALDFEGGPVCALSLAGSSGAGKKMIARGLAECINTESACSGMDLIRPHAHDLLKSPFLVVDEGLPSSVKGGMDIADTFRSAVAGEAQTVNLKYGDLITINSPLRVIFLANNMEVVHALTSHRVLTPEDQTALAQRIYHLDVKDDATNWLAAGGGKFGMTKGWIADDNGQPGNYVVARHFLWLYENRPEQPLGSRFLMEGNLDGKVMREMRTQSGIAPHVIKTVISMIETEGNNHTRQGLVTHEGHVYVTAHGVVEAYLADLSTRRDLTSKQVATVLKGMVTPNSPSHARTMTTKSGARVRARWHELDITILYEEAQMAGYPSSRLSALIDEQFGNEAEAVRATIETSL